MAKTYTPTTQPHELTSQIQGSNEYLAVLARDRDDLRELPVPDRIATAIGRAAAVMVRKYQVENQTEYLDEKHQVLALLSTVSPAAEAMNVVHSPDASKEEIGQAKDTLIRFNHGVRLIIDASPSTTRRELLSLIDQLAIQVLPNDDTGDFSRETRRRVTAMQQEIFTEQALWTIPDVEVYEEVSVEDEKKGVDIRFSYKRDMYEMDVKSSEENENVGIGSSGHFRFWTGLTGYQLGESFRANDEQLAIIRARLLARLDAEQAKAV